MRERLKKYWPSKDAIWIGAGVLLGQLLGQGALWGFLQFTQGREAQQLLRDQRSAELRSQRDELFQQIVGVQTHLRRLIACNPNNTNLDATDDFTAYDHQFSLLQDDFVATEKALAKLEKRSPHDIRVDFVRPGPPGPIEVHHVGPNGIQVLVAKSDTIRHPDCPRS